MDGKIILRFTTSTDTFSEAIRFQAGLSVPFTPSHVECVSLDGQWWIGQHAEGGMAKRPAGYDSSTLMKLPDGTLSNKFVTLPCTPDQQKCFYDHIESRVGAPYDMKSIANFADPKLNLHDVGHLICSAEMAWALRQNPFPYFSWPTTKPLHRWSPDMLFLILSTHVEVSHTGELP